MIFSKLHKYVLSILTFWEIYELYFLAIDIKKYLQILIFD